MIISIQQGLRAEGLDVSIAKLCRWFGVARRTMYYRPTKAPPKVREELATPIKQLIESESRRASSSSNAPNIVSKLGNTPAA